MSQVLHPAVFPSRMTADSIRIVGIHENFLERRRSTLEAFQASVEMGSGESISFFRRLGKGCLGRASIVSSHRLTAKSGSEPRPTMNLVLFSLT